MTCGVQGCTAPSNYAVRTGLTAFAADAIRRAEAVVRRRKRRRQHETAQLEDDDTAEECTEQQ